jgi:hypothetical protein
MSESRRAPLFKGSAILAIVVAGLVFLYLASVGPVYGLLANGYLSDPDRHIHNFYQPLRWLCENSHVAAAIVLNYLRLFDAN